MLDCFPQAGISILLLLLMMTRKKKKAAFVSCCILKGNLSLISNLVCLQLC